MRLFRVRLLWDQARRTLGLCRESSSVLVVLWDLATRSPGRLGRLTVRGERQSAVLSSTKSKFLLAMLVHTLLTVFLPRSIEYLAGN